MYDAPFAKGDLRVAFKTSGFDESKVSSCTKKSSQFFLSLAAAAHALQPALCGGSSFSVSDIAGFETLSGDDRRALQQPGPPPPSVLRAKAEAEAAAAAKGDSPAHVGGPQLPPEVVAALPALVADRKNATSAKDLGADGGGELFLSGDCAVQLVSRATKYVTKACGDNPQPQRQCATCHAPLPHAALWRSVAPGGNAAPCRTRRRACCSGRLVARPALAPLDQRATRTAPHCGSRCCCWARHPCYASAPRYAFSPRAGLHSEELT